MAKTVAVNYTPEQTLALVEQYQSGETVQTLAVQFGKTVRSIVAKLSREGVYQKQGYASKTGERPVKKDAHADAIGAILGLSEADTTSLAKANKSALAAVFAALASSKPI
jgi:hypothetical protein